MELYSEDKRGAEKLQEKSGRASPSSTPLKAILLGPTTRSSVTQLIRPQGKEEQAVHVESHQFFDYITLAGGVHPTCIETSPGNRFYPSMISEAWSPFAWQISI